MTGWATRVTGFEVRRLAGHVNEGLLVGAGVIEGLTLANYPERAAVIAGLATLLAGAVSVASGSYAEMRSEQDALDSFLAEEERLRELSPQEELAELTEIYLAKGLPASLAREVAEHLPVREALAEHAVSKLGISPTYLDPRPVLAAVLMALAFVVGALAPIGAVLLAPDHLTTHVLIGAVLLGVVATALVAARTSGMSVRRTVGRSLFFGALALLLSAFIGRVGV